MIKNIIKTLRFFTGAFFYIFFISVNNYCFVLAKIYDYFSTKFNLLVSVTERTKEIGIRKAIGAKKSDIVSQFLAESVLMAVIGGVIGILLSMLVVRTVNHVQDTIHAVITVKSVLIAVLSSISIGLIFGIMPARNAAKLKPIDALRFE